MDPNTSSVPGEDPEAKLSTLTEVDPKIDFMNSVDVEREIVGENGVRLILAEGSSDGDLSQWKGMPYEDYFRGQCRTMTRFYILIIVLVVVCVVPIALASILVVKPFVSTLNFRETTCHVVNVTNLGNGSRCLQVFVQFTDRDTGNNVTTVLYPNEDRLDNKVLIQVLMFTPPPSQLMVWLQIQMRCPSCLTVVTQFKYM